MINLSVHVNHSFPRKHEIHEDVSIHRKTSSVTQDICIIFLFCWIFTCNEEPSLKSFFSTSRCDVCRSQSRKASCTQTCGEDSAAEAQGGATLPQNLKRLCKGESACNNGLLAAAGFGVSACLLWCWWCTASWYEAPSLGRQDAESWGSCNPDQSHVWERPLPISARRWARPKTDPACRRAAQVEVSRTPSRSSEQATGPVQAAAAGGNQQGGGKVWGE